MDKRDKILVIEAMLDDMDMSKQELIDLINTILNLSISTEKKNEIPSITSNLVDAKYIEDAPEILEMTDVEQELFLLGKDSALYIDTSSLEKLLTIEEIKNISVRLSVSYCMELLKRLGLRIDLQKLSSMLAGEQILSLSRSGQITTPTQKRFLDVKEIAKVREFFEANINAQIQNTVAPDVNKGLVNFISNATNNIANGVRGVADQVKTTMHQLDRRAQVDQMRRLARQAGREGSFMRRYHRAASTLLGNVGRVSFKGKDISISFKDSKTASQYGVSAGQEVNIKDIKNDKLNSKDFKSLEASAQANANEILKSTEKGFKNPTKNAAISVDEKGSLSVATKTLGKKKEVPLMDFIKDAAKNMLDKLNKNKGEDDQARLKILRLEDGITDKNPKNKTSDREQTRDTSEKHQEKLNKLDAIHDAFKLKESLKSSSVFSSKGLNALTADPNATGGTAVNKELSQMPIIVEGGKGSEVTNKPTPKSESKKTADDLVKLDALADKSKALENLKSELKDGLKDATKEAREYISKNMAEAQKNKDVVDDMRKQIQNDKSKHIN